MNKLSDKELRDMQSYGFLPREDEPIIITVMAAEILELRAQVAELERRLAVKVMLPERDMGWSKDTNICWNNGISAASLCIKQAGFQVEE